MTTVALDTCHCILDFKNQTLVQRCDKHSTFQSALSAHQKFNLFFYPAGSEINEASFKYKKYIKEKYNLKRGSRIGK